MRPPKGILQEIEEGLARFVEKISGSTSEEQTEEENN